MRTATLATILFLASCSEAPPENKTTEAAAADALQPGRWEVTTEIGRVDAQDQGKPVLTAGKLVSSHCVGAGEGKKPAAAMLSGLDKAECSYENSYLARGRLNASLSCNREGINGKILVSASGTFTATSFESDNSFRTYLPGDGDVHASAKTTGRRTGECSAPAAG